MRGEGGSSGGAGQSWRLSGPAEGRSGLRTERRWRDRRRQSSWWGRHRYTGTTGTTVCTEGHSVTD